MEIAFVLAVIAVIFIVRTVKIVPQQHAWVVERLGKYDRTLTPGLKFVVPFIERVAYKHSLKEVPLDVPSQVCITRDNTQLQVDGIIYFQARATTSWRSPNWRRRCCVPSSARWSSTRPSRNATPSMPPSSAPSTTPPATGASRCCATRSRT
jgi:hypothetical protein